VQKTFVVGRSTVAEDFRTFSSSPMLPVTNLYTILTVCAYYWLVRYLHDVLLVLLGPLA